MREMPRYRLARSLMIYSATARFGTFCVHWSECKPGALSTDHKRLMPMMPDEVAMFTKMVKDGKTMDENSHWVYGIANEQA